MGSAAGKPVWQPRGLRPTSVHLAQRVTHVSDDLQCGDLATRVVGDSVLRRDLQGGMRRLNTSLAVLAGENTVEGDRQHVRDHECRVFLGAVHDADVLAEIGEGSALPTELVHELAKAQVGEGRVQRGSEARCDEPSRNHLGACRSSTDELLVLIELTHVYPIGLRRLVAPAFYYKINNMLWQCFMKGIVFHL